MSDYQPTTYNVRIELMNADGEIIGTVSLDGANGGGAPGQGSLIAGGVCNYGPSTPLEVAGFLENLAADLRRSAQSVRLDS